MFQASLAAQNVQPPCNRFATETEIAVALQSFPLVRIRDYVCRSGEGLFSLQGCSLPSVLPAASAHARFAQRPISLQSQDLRLRRLQDGRNVLLSAATLASQPDNATNCTQYDASRLSLRGRLEHDARLAGPDSQSRRH